MKNKKSYLLCLVFFVVFILSACSTSTVTDLNNSDAIGEQKEEQASEGSETRVYESTLGNIELPLHPERVVVAVQDYVGDILALGVTPVGAAGWVFETPYYEEQLKGVESVGDKTSFSVEKIMSLNPDIIITYSEEQYDQLVQIAPTVVVPYGQQDYRERLREFAKILNREAEAEAWLAKLDQKIETKKEELFKHVDQSEKVVILELAQKEIYLMGKSYGRGGQIIYNDLGFRAPAKVEEVAFKEGWASIALESLPEFLGEADHIFLGVRDSAVGTEGSQERKGEVTSLSVWKDLPAVKAGNVHEYQVQTFYFQDPIAIDNQLDFIVEQMISNR